MHTIQPLPLISLSDPQEKILADEPLHWQSISCIKEDIIDPTTEDISKLDKRVRNKINKATKAGVHIYEDSYKCPEGALREQANAGIDAWESQKKGAQISVSGVGETSASISHSKAGLTLC